MKFRIPFLTLLLLFLTGVAFAAPDTRAAEEDNIREAVHRYQFGDNASAQQANTKVYFLSLAGRKDPSDEFMARFKDHKPPVRKVSQADSSKGRVKDKESGADGIILYTGKITWKSDTEVTVEGGYYEGNLSASGNNYSVVKKDGVWKVTGNAMIWIS